MTKTLVLVDFSWVLNRFFFGFKDHYIKKNDENIFIGSLLGYTLFAERIVKKYPDAKVMFCLDGECTKKSFNEDYKAHRDEERKKQVYKDTNTLINLLSNVKNFYFAKNEKQEADDTIAVLAYKYKDNFDDIIIYSGDKDFFQLSETFKVSNEYDKGFKFINNNTVFQKFGVATDNLLAFRVLDGDVSDNLKAPVPRIRTVFKKEIAEKWTTLDIDDFINLMYEYKGTKWEKSANQYLEAIDLVENNLAIMNLKKYSEEDNRFKVDIFKCNECDLSLVNYYGLRQYEKFLYDYFKGGN